MKTLNWLLKACWDAAWAAKSSHFHGPDERDMAYAHWRQTRAVAPLPPPVGDPVKAGQIIGHVNGALTGPVEDGFPDYSDHFAQRVRDALPTPTYEQVYQAWHGTTESWGGCADSGAVERVMRLFTGSEGVT